MENFPKNLRLLRILSAESTFGAKEWIVFVYFKVEILGKGLTFFFLDLIVSVSQNRRHILFGDFLSGFLPGRTEKSNLRQLKVMILLSLLVV